MKAYQLSCPACGATIEIDKDRESCFCSYCGSKILIDDNIQRIEVTKEIKYHETYTDEAKIRKIESEERMQEQKYKDKKEERKSKKWSTIGTLIIIFACLVGPLVLINFYSESHKKASDQQEQELQAIVDEVMQDIKNGNFEEAYIKAEKIRYTENWSSKIEEKWEATRNEIIKQIEKAEQEAKTSNGDDSWWNPFD